MKKFAVLYPDGSLNVSSEGDDLLKARKLLAFESEDPDVELVTVEISVTDTFGKPQNDPTLNPQPMNEP